MTYVTKPLEEVTEFKNKLEKLKKRGLITTHIDMITSLFILLKYDIFSDSRFISIETSTRSSAPNFNLTFKKLSH